MRQVCARGLLPFLLALLSFAVPASAVPPPPPPEREQQGPAKLCEAHYALRLEAGERARKYAPDLWVVLSGDRESFGVSSGALVGQIKWREVEVPGYGRLKRRPIFEWPGGRADGWQYLISDPGREPVTVSADRFNGTAADFPVVRRILTGTARDKLCPAGAAAD